MPQIHNPDAAEYDIASDAPPAFGWHRGGYVVLGYQFQNSLSVPITVTGLANDGPRIDSLIGAPRAYVPKPPSTAAYDPRHLEPLHDLYIAAGQDKEIAFVWHAQGTCSQWASHDPQSQSGESIQGVQLTYTVLGIFHESQFVPMTENQPNDGSNGYLFAAQAPHADQCPDGYPLHKPK